MLCNRFLVDSTSQKYIYFLQYVYIYGLVGTVQLKKIQKKCTKLRQPANIQHKKVYVQVQHFTQALKIYTTSAWLAHDIFYVLLLCNVYYAVFIFGVCYAPLNLQMILAYDKNRSTKLYNRFCYWYLDPHGYALCIKSSKHTIIS